jgi:hypothetical protein
VTDTASIVCFAKLMNTGFAGAAAGVAAVPRDGAAAGPALPRAAVLDAADDDAAPARGCAEDAGAAAVAL